MQCRTTVSCPKHEPGQGSALFEKLFVRTVAAYVSAGLVDGQKIHVD